MVDLLHFVVLNPFHSESDRSKHALHLIDWHRIILDESHYIKSRSTSTSNAISNLRARTKWCLTGTPFGRNLLDIDNQLRFIGMSPDDVNRLNLKKIGKKLSGGSIGRFGGTEFVPILNVMRSLVIRHKKEQKFNGQNIVKMTAKNENVIFVDFTEEQREFYNKLYDTANERCVL